MTEQSFRVGLTADFFEAGICKFADMGLSVLDQSDIEHQPFAHHYEVISSDQLQGFNGIIALTPLVTADTVTVSDDLLAISRFGVGFDTVDVPACTEANVVVLITVGAVDRPVAEATVGWMIGLTHHLLIKDRLLRQGRWDERTGFMGRELRGRTFGAVGLGGIARETVRLLGVFGMERSLAYDPFVDATTASAAGVDLVELDELLERADFVSIHCPLTEQTRGLLGVPEIARMRPEAYLINTARGGIVDEDALFAALQQRRIAGAALDCFASEPVVMPSRFATLDNVLLAPHSIAWTDELFRDIGRTACKFMVDLAHGRRPIRGVVNPEVFERSGFRDKWQRLQSGC